MGAESFQWIRKLTKIFNRFYLIAERSLRKYETFASSLWNNNEYRTSIEIMFEWGMSNISWQRNINGNVRLSDGFCSFFMIS